MAAHWLVADPGGLLGEVLTDDGRMLERAPRSSPAPRPALRRADPDDAEVAVDLDDRDEAAAFARQLIAPIAVGA